MAGQWIQCKRALLLLFTLLRCVRGQQQYPSNTQHYPSTIYYGAKKLYDMHLDMKPTSIRLIRDPRYSSEIIPVFDMVFMSYLPRSEIRQIRDLTLKVNNPEQMGADTQVVTDHTSLEMPNNVGLLPDHTIEEQPPYVWWIATGSFGSSSGFQNSQGGVYLMDMSQDQWIPSPIYTEKHVGFSHTEWVDMDLDGNADCITIKGSLNRARLIWLGQPRSRTGSWTSHVISNRTADVGGTDFKIMRVKMNRRPNKDRMLIIIAGRRTATLTAYWVEDEDNDWTQTRNIKSTVIASSEAYVSVEIADINGDGKDDILTSVAAVAGRPGRLLAFEIPKTGFSQSGEWRKRLLQEWPSSPSNYRTLTPGPAYPFYVSTRDTQSSRKPHILVSGADDGKVYVLSSETWSPFEWQYSMDEIFAGDEPVGIPSVHDVDGDGNAEIFIPAGESIHVMRYKPSSARILSATSMQILLSATLAMMSNFLLWSR